MSLSTVIDKSEVDALVDQAPRVFNSEMNRGLRSTGGDFFRVFTKQRLQGKRGLRVRRRLASRGRGGGIRVPAKARAMGFRGFLLKRDRLDGKTAVLRNSNPVAIAHEEGATITPKGGKYLFLRVRNLAAARRAGVGIKRGRKPKVIRVRSVKLRPRLGFMVTWRGYVTTAIQRIGNSLKRAADRTIATAKRGRSRGRSR